MKKKPHLGQRRFGEFGRKASKKKAMMDGIIQRIMMMKRRFGFLSMRNPRAVRFVSLNPFPFENEILTDEQDESESVTRNCSFEKSIERSESERLFRIGS
jgi:hypothetical protein